jgi:ATP-binding cassette subfamily B protein
VRPIERAGTAIILRRAVAAVRLGWAASPRCLSITFALMVVSGAVPVVAAWATKLLLDELTRGRLAAAATIAWCVGVLALAAVAQAVASAIETYLQRVLHRDIAVAVQLRLFQRINAYTGLAAFEDPDRLDRLRLADQAGADAPEEAVSAAVHLAQAAITTAGFVATLAILWPPILAVVAAAAAVGTAQQLWLGRLRAGVASDVSMLQRRQVFLRLLLVDVRAAKEARLFGLGEFLSGRSLRDLRAANAAENAADRTGARIETTLGLLGGALGLVAISVGAYLAVHGRFSIGDVTVFLAAVVGLHGTIGAATATTARAYQALLLFGHYLAVVDEPEPARTGLAPAPLRDGVEFRDVWFRYADHLPWVLRGVNLLLPAQQTVGLVGLNGAGKSTIVKLLCRLYEPQRGSILWDGTDLRELDPARLRERMSAVFQDFMAYDFSAADNIGVGRLEALADRDRVRRAARHADVDAAIAALPRGYDTLLSRIFSADEEGGHNASLSGGQWQRIALARAFLREDADLLILDEPSSGQDAEAEHALHERLAVLRAGRLSLLISHRLNAFRDADLIVVLDDGRVVEQGTHGELLGADARYAELFRLQAAGYEPVG